MADSKDVRDELEFDVEQTSKDVYFQVDGQDLVHLELNADGTARVTVWSSSSAGPPAAAWEGTINVAEHLDTEEK